MQDRLIYQRDSLKASHSLLAGLYRNLIRLFRNKASLVSLFIIPGVIMSCLMAVFGHAAKRMGFDYSLYLMAGAMFQAAMFSAGGSVMAIAVDLESGILDRSLTTPASLGSILASRLLCDTIRSILSVLTVIVIGLVWGAKVHSFAGLALAFALALVIGAVLSLVFIALSLGHRQPVQVASLIQGLEMLFLMASTAFIPLVTLPDYISTIAYHQPFSPLIDTLRALLTGQNPWPRAWTAGAWLLLGSLVSLGLLARTFRRRHVA